MKDEDKDKKHRGSSGSGRSPTKFMERPKGSEEETETPFQDRSGDEGVDSGQVTSHDEEDEVPFQEIDSEEQPQPWITPEKKPPTSASEEQRRKDAQEYPGKDDEQE